MCIQCKLILQIQSKYIKILKKNIFKKKKTQTKLVNLKKKKGKKQVTKPKILFITLFMSLFALFIYRKKSTNRWPKKKKKAINSTYWTNQKYCGFYTFTQQVSQHLHKTFIFSCGWSQFHILLFYFCNTPHNFIWGYNNIVI